MLFWYLIMNHSRLVLYSIVLEDAPLMQSSNTTCHIHVSVNQDSIGSDNGLSPIRRKPLSEPLLRYCQSDHYEQILVKLYSKYKTFHTRK